MLWWWHPVWIPAWIALDKTCPPAIPFPSILLMPVHLKKLTAGDWEIDPRWWIMVKPVRDKERERDIYIYFYILHKFIVYVSSVYVLKALRIQYTSKLCTAMWNPCIRPLFSLQKWFQHVSRWLAWCGAGLDLNTACGLDVLGDASWPPSVVVSPAGDRPVASKMTRS